MYFKFCHLVNWMMIEMNAIVKSLLLSEKEGKITRPRGRGPDQILF